MPSSAGGTAPFFLGTTFRFPARSAPSCPWLLGAPDGSCRSHREALASGCEHRPAYPSFLPGPYRDRAVASRPCPRGVVPPHSPAGRGRNIRFLHSPPFGTPHSGSACSGSRSASAGFWLPGTPPFVDFCRTLAPPVGRRDRHPGRPGALLSSVLRVANTLRPSPLLDCSGLAAPGSPLAPPPTPRHGWEGWRSDRSGRRATTFAGSPSPPPSTGARCRRGWPWLRDFGCGLSRFAGPLLPTYGRHSSRVTPAGSRLGWRLFPAAACGGAVCFRGRFCVLGPPRGSRAGWSACPPGHVPARWPRMFLGPSGFRPSPGTVRLPASETPRRAGVSGEFLSDPPFRSFGGGGRAYCPTLRRRTPQGLLTASPPGGLPYTEPVLLFAGNRWRSSPGRSTATKSLIRFSRWTLSELGTETDGPHRDQTRPLFPCASLTAASAPSMSLRGSPFFRSLFDPEETSLPSPRLLPLRLPAQVWVFARPQTPWSLLGPEPTRSLGSRLVLRGRSRAHPGRRACPVWCRDHRTCTSPSVGGTLRAPCQRLAASWGLAGPGSHFPDGPLRVSSGTSRLRTLPFRVLDSGIGPSEGSSARYQLLAGLRSALWDR